MSRELQITRQLAIATDSEVARIPEGKAACSGHRIRGGQYEQSDRIVRGIRNGEELGIRVSPEL